MISGFQPDGQGSSPCTRSNNVNEVYMNIYTGYYAKTKKYEEDGLCTVGVSGKRPDFFKGIAWKDVAPRWEHYSKWKSGEIGNDEYIELYTQMLDNLSKEDVSQFLKKLEEEYEDIILLCYEKPGSFCHRHALADWLESKMGTKPIKEYEI